MLLSTKGRYGLRLMICLGRRYGSGLLGVEEMSVSEGISGNYIHLLLGTLRGFGLIRSVRGREGGYELARSPDTITLLEIITALEGRNLLVECVNESSVCSRSATCSARQVWCRVANAMQEVLQNTTLRHLLENACDKNETLNYCI